MATPRHGSREARDQSLRVRWQPLEFPFREKAEEILRSCVRELGLAGVVHDLHVSIDLENRDDHAYIEWNTHDHRAARLAFAVGNFVTRERRRAWARTWGRREGLPRLVPRQFSPRSFAEACLHELSHLKDDHESGVDLSSCPEPDREAFNELWNVWIDGRLHRRGLPSMTRGERRRVYARTLSKSPGYAKRGERIFRALWTADHLRPAELRAYLDELRG
ncbi:MAG TPA: hypothetical protein VFS09_10940 [Candidatus Eisenbacteria bacterium]|nr:hypothetical protein [Candidatus Eisenbacteria bacterium]